MYLESITLNNFRSFSQCTIPLSKDLTIFVGENNGGKSNVIDAIRLLTKPLSGRRELYCEATDVRFGVAAQAFEIVGHFTALTAAQQGRLLTAATDDDISGCVFGLRYEETGRLPVRPVLWSGRLQGTPEAGCHEMVRHVYLPPLRDAKKELASGNPTRIYALLNHFLEGQTPEELALALARTQGSSVLDKVSNAVQTNLGALTSGVRTQSTALGFADNERLIDVARDLRFKLADHGIDPEELRYSGHGYANLLYMATIAVELEKVNDADLTLFLVEEPEAHLHPQLQAAVLGFLDEQAEKSRLPKPGYQGPAGELQIIVATHSPNLSAWVESRNVVFFRSLTPTPDPPVDNQLKKAARKESRCIPLADLALSPAERRKVDRYLDVTKSAMLFGGRILLVEGIAEALLIPIFARKFVFNQSPEKLRVFRSAVFVPIEGVDFEPYAKLLLTPSQDVRIADRLVIVTDGDGFELQANEKSPGALRKEKLEGIAAGVQAGTMLNVVVSDYSLESELVRAGNGELLREVYLQMHPRSAAKWDDAAKLTDEAQAAAIQDLFENTPKGDFAQLLAEKINEGKAFAVPTYLDHAIKSIVR